eukprot:TRINITY_DN3294_c0_g3_i1.p1 TRINITY_DN3294_c0_g3~~TRINITY_DN3294_c0_g3_i1.p1  ORF type:complete len:721 (-),score=132.86 TRINITY_DN3294_c0_g3_i1:111-2273(-)
MIMQGFCNSCSTRTAVIITCPFKCPLAIEKDPNSNCWYCKTCRNRTVFLCPRGHPVDEQVVKKTDEPSTCLENITHVDCDNCFLYFQNCLCAICLSCLKNAQSRLGQTLRCACSRSTTSFVPDIRPYEVIILFDENVILKKVKILYNTKIKELLEYCIQEYKLSPYCELVFSNGTKLPLDYRAYQCGLMNGSQILIRSLSSSINLIPTMTVSTQQQQQQQQQQQKQNIGFSTLTNITSLPSTSGSLNINGPALSLIPIPQFTSSSTTQTAPKPTAKPDIVFLFEKKSANTNTNTNTTNTTNTTANTNRQEDIEIDTMDVNIYIKRWKFSEIDLDINIYCGFPIYLTVLEVLRVVSKLMKKYGVIDESLLKLIVDGKTYEHEELLQVFGKRGINAKIWIPEYSEMKDKLFKEFCWDGMSDFQREDMVKLINGIWRGEMNNAKTYVEKNGKSDTLVFIYGHDEVAEDDEGDSPRLDRLETTTTSPTIPNSQSPSLSSHSPSTMPHRNPRPTYPRSSPSPSTLRPRRTSNSKHAPPLSLKNFYDGIKKVFVYVDLSNIVVGFKYYNQRKRLDTNKLIKFVERDLSYESFLLRFAAGSEASKESRKYLLSEWEPKGYECKLELRVRGEGESSIDTLLQSKILRSIDDYKKEKGNLLILLTGDGNDEDKAWNFPRCCKSAIENGFKVHVMAWKGCISSEYSKLQSTFPENMRVTKLEFENFIARQ